MTAQHLALIALGPLGLAWFCVLLLTIEIARNILSDYIDNMVGASPTMSFVGSRQVQGAFIVAMQTTRYAVGYRFNVCVKLT